MLASMLDLESEVHDSKELRRMPDKEEAHEPDEPNVQHSTEVPERPFWVRQEPDAGLSESVLLHHEPSTQQVRETGGTADFGDTESQIARYRG